MCLCAVIISCTSAVKIPKEIKKFFYAIWGEWGQKKSIFCMLWNILYCIAVLLLMRIIVANDVLWSVTEDGL